MFTLNKIFLFTGTGGFMWFVFCSQSSNGIHAAKYWISGRT